MADEEKKGIFKEFKEFIAKGDAFSMAVGIVIGGAFTAIVNSIVDDLINPLISLLTGGIDFSTLSVTFGEGENAAAFNYGSLIMAIINFFCIALVLFLLVRYVDKLKAGVDSLKKSEEAEEEATEKECPFCYSMGPIKASRCPHCTSELEVESAGESA